MNIITAYVTCSTREEAERIARCIVSERLAACANLWDGTTSIYRWEGDVQTAPETVLLLKSRPELGEQLVQRVRELHSYQCPCIVLWESAGGNEDYLKWVRDQTWAVDSSSTQRTEIGN